MRREMSIVREIKQKYGLQVSDGGWKFIINVLYEEYKYRGMYEKEVAGNIAKLIGANCATGVYVPEFLEEELAVLWFGLKSDL